MNITLTRDNLLNVSDQMQRIPLLGASAAKVQEEIILLAASAFVTVADHGNTNPLVALMNALPNGQRAQSIAYWAKVNSNKKISLLQDSKTKVWSCKLHPRTAEDFNVDKALAVSAFNLTAEKNPEPMTLEKLLKFVRNTANDTSKIEGTDKFKVPEGVRLAAIKMLAAVESV